MQAQYDRFEQLVFDAQLSVAIFGNPETSDFELIDLSTPGPLSEDQLSCARRMPFVGVFAIVRCVPRTAIDVPLDDATYTVLAQAFVRHIEVRANAELEAQFLTRIFALEDTRN
jgi:hypothetical protein